MKRNTEIAVLTTVYNSISYLPETVNSVLAQTCRSFLYIIVNDGSNDGTGAYLESLSDPRIKILDLPRCGRGIALNKGLKACCHYDFIAILDADDIASKYRLEIQNHFLQQNPELAVLSSEFTINQKNLWGQEISQPSFSEINPKEFIKRNPICHSSVMMRATALKDVGSYDDMGRTELFDYDLWIRLGAKGYRFGKVGLPLLFKRIHKDQNFERKHRLRYLRSALKCKHRAIRLFSNSSFDYIYPLITFVYGLLPIELRRPFIDKF